MLSQISIYTENKKGAMREITELMQQQDINILGSVNNDSAEYGIVRMVVLAARKRRCSHFLKKDICAS